VVRLKTLICKAVGVLFSVAGGKEKHKFINFYFVITAILLTPHSERGAKKDSC